MDFEWDDDKNQANHQKHGIWFEEAKTAFIVPKNYQPGFQSMGRVLVGRKGGR